MTPFEIEVYRFIGSYGSLSTAAQVALAIVDALPWAFGGYMFATLNDIAKRVTKMDIRQRRWDPGP